MSTLTISQAAESITDQQIDEILKLLGDELRKRRLEFASSAIQGVIKYEGLSLIEDFLTPFRGRIERRLEMIVREFIINRIPRQQPENNTLEIKIVAPDTTGTEKITAVFFRLSDVPSDDELAREYEERGLIPIDPDDLTAINKADPSFADKYHNGTQYKDKDGDWRFKFFLCCACRGDYSGAKRIKMGDNYWWFGGIPISNK